MSMDHGSGTHMDHGSGTHMDHGSGTDSGGGGMTMVFFQSLTTPLFSTAWTPANRGAYAGTCIFLIALATAHCALMAARNALAVSVWRPRGKLGASPEGEADDDAAKALASSWRGHPFHIWTEASRAVFEVVISGVGYLLMLAVMTMNVGYFLSVLGGIFLGTFLVGRFGGFGSHH